MWLQMVISSRGTKIVITFIIIFLDNCLRNFRAIFIVQLKLSNTETEGTERSVCTNVVTVMTSLLRLYLQF